MSFQPNQQIYTCTAVNLRAAPGHLGNPPPAVLTLLPERTVCRVTGAATIADELTWWPLRVVLDGGQVMEGWAAEAQIALTPDEQAYLDSSIAEREHQQAEETERQRRELDAAHGTGHTHTTGDATPAARQPAGLLSAFDQQRQRPLGRHWSCAAAGDADPRGRG